MSVDFQAIEEKLKELEDKVKEEVDRVNEDIEYVQDNVKGFFTKKALFVYAVGVLFGLILGYFIGF